jgi:hypothetical protein
MISLPTRKAWPALLALVAFTLIGAGCKNFFVDPKLTTIAVTPATTTVAVNATTPLIATGTYDDNSTKDVTGSALWSVTASTPANDVTVTTTGTKGVVKGVFVGTATVQAAIGAINGSSNITVGPTLTSIAVTPAAMNVAVNGTLQYKATGTFSDTTTKDITTSVTWASSDVNVTINSGGLATVGAAAISGETSNITAVSGSITSNPVAVLTVN